MQASQAINVNPQSQAAAVKPSRNGGRENQAGKFGDIMNQETATKPNQVAAKHNSSKHTPQVRPEATEETNTQQEENNNIVAFPAITAFDPTNQIETPQEKALRLLDAIAAILEGNQGNNLNMKEIAPLLQELAQTMQEIPPQSADMQKLLSKLDALLEEVQARMPLNEEIADSAQKMSAMDKLQQILGQLRGNPSPFENVNENTNKAPEAEAPLKPVATAEQKATTADEDNSRQQREPNQTATTHNQQQFRVDMAPQRVFFADAQAAAGATAPRFVPMTPESLFGAMIDRIVALPGADPHMEIALKPDHLGKLTIDLSLGEQGLTAKIIASDEGVRNMLAAHVNRLSETLAEKGIRVENVEIVYSPLADKQSGQQQPNRDEQSKDSSYRPPVWGVTENPPLGWDNAYTDSPYTDEWGTSSVEYHA